MTSWWLTSCSRRGGRGGGWVPDVNAMLHTNGPSQVMVINGEYVLVTSQHLFQFFSGVFVNGWVGMDDHVLDNCLMGFFSCIFIIFANLNSLNNLRNSPFSKGTTSSLGFIRRISMMWRSGEMRMRGICKLGHILLASDVQHFAAGPNDLMTNLHCITISLREGISTVLWTITLLHQNGPWRQCRLKTCPSMVSV